MAECFLIDLVQLHVQLCRPPLPLRLLHTLTYSDSHSATMTLIEWSKMHFRFSNVNKPSQPTVPHLFGTFWPIYASQCHLFWHRCESITTDHMDCLVNWRQVLWFKTNSSASFLFPSFMFPSQQIGVGDKSLFTSFHYFFWSFFMTEYHLTWLLNAYYDYFHFKIHVTLK